MKRDRIKNVERMTTILGEEVVIRTRRSTPPELRRGGVIDPDKRRYSRKTKHKGNDLD